MPHHNAPLALDPPTNFSGDEDEAHETYRQHCVAVGDIIARAADVPVQVAIRPYDADLPEDTAAGDPNEAGSRAILARTEALIDLYFRKVGAPLQ